MPQLSIKFYEAATGRLVVSPYLTADAGVYGQVLADITPVGTTTDADYWLTQGQIAGGVDAYLMADLSILDYTLIKWPATANINDYTTFTKIPLIPNSPLIIAGLPKLSATYDATTKHPTDSRAYLIKGRATDIANPFQSLFGGPASFLPFASWTQPKVIALNNTGYNFVPSPVGSDSGVVWITFTNPGTYTLRLGGNSSMGGWARQVTEVLVTVTDANNNGIIDQWETKYGLLGTGAAIAAADPDGDGLTNLQEFQRGSNPLAADALSPFAPSQTVAITQVIDNFGSSVGPLLQGASTDDTTPSLSGTLSATLTSTQTLRVFNGNTILGGATVSGTTWSFTPNALAYGSYSFAAAVVSVDGIEGVRAPVWSQTINDGSCPAGQLPQNGVCVAPIATGQLPDTGITASQCYQAGSNVLVSCTSAGAIALNDKQDGMVGRDVSTPDPSDGKLGFSYTKLDASGNALPASAASWSCVKDNITGLTWEVKTADGGLRDKSKTYTNWGDGRSGDASAFAAAVNATSLCGYTDWRLPTAFELQGIVDYGVAYPGPSVDGAWFINSVGNRDWSSSPYAGFADSAWGVGFSSGYVNGDLRSFYGAVRLVR